MRGVFLFLFFSIVLQVNGQFSIGIGTDVAFLRTEEVYNYNLLVYNENETAQMYRVRNELNPVSNGIVLRSFGGQFLNKKKLTIGYSLEIGYHYFSSKSNLAYLGSSTLDKDSIVYDFDNFSFRTNYHALRFNHFLDVHWNPTDDVKITNSLGVGLGAIVRGNAPYVDFDGTMINTNHPIMKFSYQPQVTEKYKRFSMTYFATIDLFSMSLFTKEKPYDTPDYRIAYSKLRFNAMGLRFIPHLKEKERPTFEMY